MTGPTVDAGARWRERLEGRAVPPEILAAASDDPHRQFPERFAVAAAPAQTPSRRAGLALLDGVDRAGLLDVGCGPGAASLALCPPGVHVTGVDDATDMLAAFTRECLERGVPSEAVLGTWPDAAAVAGSADVVLAHHVLYNAPDLAGFVRGLDAAARRGVVVEITAEHPQAWLDPLWERFHGLRRPAPPTAEDALAVLAVLGLHPQVERWSSGPSRGERAGARERARHVRRRLCLPEHRSDEVAAALAELDPPPAEKVTLHWATSDRSRPPR